MSRISIDSKLLTATTSQKLVVLQHNTPDVRSRIRETARLHKCSTDTAIDILATRRLSLYEFESEIAGKEFEARVKQAREYDSE